MHEHWHYHNYWMKWFILTRQFEILLFGEYKQRMPVRIFIDSEPTLESVASTNQIEKKGLRMTVQMKERLIKGDVKSYHWIPQRKCGRMD